MTATAVPPQVNLDPNAAEKRSFTEVHRVKSAAYEYASDDYAAKAGHRQLQLSIEWEGLTYRFSDNPTTNPVLRRSINVTDKNGAVMTWGDPANPEPTTDDSFPIQVSKHFAKCGVVLGTDPHVLDGLVFKTERTKLRAGKSEITTLIPLAQLPKDFSVPEAEIRIVSPREQGEGGNPAAGGTAVASGPSEADAFKALAQAMNGKPTSEMVNIALAESAVAGNSDVLAKVAQNAPAIEALKEFGSFSPEGVFTLTA